MSGDAVTDIYNFRAVRDGLLSGGQPSEAQLRRLAEEGCRRVINLALHDDPRYSLPDEAGLVASLGMEYVHIPVIWDAPQAADLARFFAAMDASGAEQTLVHCAANMRVSAFLGLYFLLREGQAEAQAFALMHSLWEPEGAWAQFIAEAIATPPCCPPISA